MPATRKITTKKSQLGKGVAKPLTAAQVIARDMPGYRIVKRSMIPAQQVAPPDAVSPDLDEIRRRYGLAVEASLNMEKSPTNTSGIVLVEPKVSSSAAGPKAVVISSGRIIGRQG